MCETSTLYLSITRQGSAMSLNSLLFRNVYARSLSHVLSWQTYMSAVPAGSWRTTRSSTLFMWSCRIRQCVTHVSYSRVVSSIVWRKLIARTARL